MSGYPISRRRFEQGVLVFDYGASRVRCGGTFEKPWFVAQDVCDALGIAEAKSALRSVPENEKGVQTLHTLGGKQSVLVLYEPGLYRIAFRSNKDEAEAFRHWVFHEVLPSIRKTGEYRLKQRQRYQQMGLSPEWIERREQGIVARHQLTDALQAHGINEGWEYGRITNTVYIPVLGGDANSVKRRLGLPAKTNLRDNLPLRELLAVGLAELLAQENLERENSQGFQACQRTVAVAANNVGNAVKMTESGRTLPPA